MISRESKVEVIKRGHSTWYVVLAFCSGLYFGPQMAEAKNITIGLIERGVTATNVCESIKDGDVITLRTRGGSVSEGHALVECIRSKDVIVKVVKAQSAGVFVVLGAKKVCLTDNVNVGTHSPYIMRDDGSIRELSADQLRESLGSWGVRLRKQGYPKATVFYLLGITFLTPPEHMTRFTKETLVAVLGDRYIGTCKDVL
jgi:hypothetical protein